MCIEIVPTGAALGAEIRGVNLAESVDDETFDAIERAYNDCGRDAHYWAPTGSPEAVARPRFPQNVACGFPALRSSEDDSQHCESL